jgi:hypothetical protein
MKVSDESILIDIADIDTIEKEIKQGGILQNAIFKVRCMQQQIESVLPSEMTVKEFNQQENTILLHEIEKRFNKGLSFSYQDERSDTKGKIFFISAKPDGSEFLMRMDIENNERKMISMKQVTSEGQGQYYLRLYGK